MGESDKKLELYKKPALASQAQLEPVVAEEESAESSKETQDIDAMKKLKLTVQKLYSLVKGGKSDPHNEVVNMVFQLGEIQKCLEFFDESRDYVMCRYKFLKGSGDENEKPAAE